MVGRTLLHYSITEQIGEGGMGIVYKARDKRLNRTVVVKTLRPDRLGDTEKKKRFVQEAQAASALNHPNIVTIHDIATFEDLDLMVMEYVDGRALDSIIRAGAIEIETAVKYGIQIASALAAAHSNGIVHRDLKPGNVMVTNDGLVKLLDFGLAKLTEKPRGDLDATTTDVGPSTIEGVLVGTIAYMSPEQALGDTLDGRSDLFSFGAVLFEMLTGRRAFHGGSAIATLSAVLRENPPRAATLNDRVPEPLDRLIAACLSKLPADRPATAADIKRELESVLSRGQSARSSSMAVLPFVNWSGDGSLDPVSQGLSKDLAGALTRVPALRVVVPAAAGIPVDRPLDIQAIGRKLRADLILDGTVRRTADRIRITAELISAADGYHLWSERYDRDAADVFDMQDEICRDIVHRVRKHVALSQSAVGSGVENLYAEGRAHLDRFTSAGLLKAKECLDKAILLQRDSAPVYAAIAEYYVNSALLGAILSGEAMKKADWAARKSLAIDEANEQAQACLGIVHGLHEYDWDAGDARFERALEINPGSAAVRRMYAIWHLLPSGRLPEAISEMDKGLRANPASPLYLASMAYIRYVNREIDESKRLCLAALESDSGHWFAHWVLSWTRLAARDTAAALAAENVSETDAWASLVCMARGEIDRGFHLAAAAVQKREAIIPVLLRHLLFANHSADSRYRDLLVSIGRMKVL